MSRPITRSLTKNQSQNMDKNLHRSDLPNTGPFLDQSGDTEVTKHNSQTSESSRDEETRHLPYEVHEKLNPKSDCTASIAEMIQMEQDRREHEHYSKLCDYVKCMFRPTIDDYRQQLERTQKESAEFRSYLEEKFGPSMATKAAKQRTNYPPYDRVNVTGKNPTSDVRILERGKMPMHPPGFDMSNGLSMGASSSGINSSSRVETAYMPPGSMPMAQNMINNTYSNSGVNMPRSANVQPQSPEYSMPNTFGQNHPVQNNRHYNMPNEGMQNPLNFSQEMPNINVRQQGFPMNGNLVAPQMVPHADVNQGITRGELDDILRETLGSGYRMPQRMVYTKPYPAWIDILWEFPRGTRCPDFHLFSGNNGQTTMEHIGRFTLQCGELAHNDFFKLRLFPSSLTGTAFSWWLTLKPNSIQNWQDLERSFHNHFYEAVPEITVTDMARICQESDETVTRYIARFRKFQSRCTTDMAERDYVKLAKKGLKGELRRRFAGSNFYDLCHLVTEVSEYERELEEFNEMKNSSKGTYYKNPVNYTDYYSDSDESDVDVALAQLDLSGAKKPYLCKSLVKPDSKVKQPQRFTFNVDKTEEIFNILLKDKKIKLPEGHVIPSAEQLKDKKYCKWHARYSHTTNECHVLRSVLQKALENGELALPEDKVATKKPNSAAVNMISIGEKKTVDAAQIVAQGGVYLNLKHPEVKQRYIDAEAMQEYVAHYGQPLFCMRCACELASPADTKGKGKMVEKIPAKERLSVPYVIPRGQVVNKRPPVKQSDGLFYDRRNDSYFLKRSIYDEYGPDGGPVYSKAPRKSSVYSDISMPKFGISQRETFPRQRMIKPIEPRDMDWHQNVQVKRPHSPVRQQQYMTRTQIRRAQRLYGQRMRANHMAAKDYDTRGEPSVSKTAKSLNAENESAPESSSRKTVWGPPKVTLNMLKEKTEKLEQEKKALQAKLAEKLDDKVLEGDDLMTEEDENSSEEIQFGTMPKTSINMVFTLPKGFQAIDVSSDQSDPESADSSLRDYLVPDSDDDGVLSLDIQDDADSCKVINTIPFGKPTKEMANQVKPLYMRAKFDGMPINKILIDSGAGINVITMSTLRKLGKTKEDLFEPLQTLTNFTGGVEQAIGMLPIEVKIGSKKKLTGFYVLEAAVSYNALLGRDWIHSTKCIPSSLHQSLIFWKGDDIELVKADQQPFERCVNTAEARYYNAEERPIDCRNFYDGHYKKLAPEADADDDMATLASPINLHT